MTKLDTDLVAACGVLVDPGVESDDKSFKHLGTAWSVKPGEWVTAWREDVAPQASARLVLANGEVAEISQWEMDEESPIAGFVSAQAEATLEVAEAGRLTKHVSLRAFGYPSVIDHSVFNLQRSALTTELYIPYLCPWEMSGHCCLFSVEEGYLTGRSYYGMQGGPVVDDEGAVVGVIVGGTDDPNELPLTRFHRLA